MYRVKLLIGSFIKVTLIFPLSILKNLVFIYFVLLREVYVLARAHIWKSVDHLWKSSMRSLRIWVITQIFRLGRKCLPMESFCQPILILLVFNVKERLSFRGLICPFFSLLEYVSGHKVQYPEVSWKENTLWKSLHYWSIGPLWANNNGQKTHSHGNTDSMVCACVFVTMVIGGQESSGIRCDCYWVDGEKSK